MTNKDLESKLESEKNLVIISGGRRGIGKSFADYYAKFPNTDVYRISHSGGSGVTHLDLGDENEVYRFVSGLDARRTGSLVFLHAVGTDKFEPDGKPEIDHDNDGIDDEVYRTNVTYFLNLAQPLIKKVKEEKVPTTIINIGSISDAYMVPFWQSFSKSNNIVRRYCKSLADENIKSVFLNVSSTLDENNNTYGRKNADIRYWQTADELVTKAKGVLENLNNINSPYSEFDFFKFNPSYRGDYFTDLSRLFASWQRDMGLCGKEVPHGIRI